MFIAVGTDNSDGVYGFYDQIQYLLAQDTVPTVLSTSYEFDQDTISLEMAKSVSVPVFLICGIFLISVMDFLL